MEARLYKRGRVWWAWGFYVDGSRWQKSTKCRDYDAAARKALVFDRERSALDRAQAEPLGIEQAFLDLIAAKEREGRSEHTIRNYRNCGGHLVRLLGRDRDVNTLTLGDLETYIDKRTVEGGHNEKTMRSTIALELKMLRAVLLYARRHGRYRGEISRIWPHEALRNANTQHERWLTRDEFMRLHAELDFDGRADYLTAYVFTGARRSEVWRIRPEHVGLASGLLDLRGTKTKGAKRIIPIAPELRPVLARRLEMTPRNAPLFPKWEEHRVIQNACKRAGIAPVSANDLRRTFCSWLAQAGVPLLVTVQLMGHRSADMVTKVYAHFGTDDLKAAIGALPTLLHNRSGGTVVQFPQRPSEPAEIAEKHADSVVETTEHARRSNFCKKLRTARKRPQNKGKKR